MTEQEKLRIPSEFRQKKVVDLRGYQEQAAKARNPDPPWTREATVLDFEGWTYQVRCGRRIWSEKEGDPVSAWYSEETAYEIATKGRWQ